MDLKSKRFVLIMVETSELPPLFQDDLQRLLDGVSNPDDWGVDPDVCCIWKGAIRPQNTGYGSIKINKKCYGAHRLSFYWYYGWEPYVCRHDCGNRRCCNPLHLDDGDHKDNEQDKIKDGTYYKGTRSEDYISPCYKKYIVTSPEGEEFEIEGMRKFCIEHNLISTMMCAVANGKRQKHKGWKARKIT